MESTNGFAKSGVVICFSQIWKDTYLFIYLQSVSIPRPMNSHLTKAQDGVLLGGFSSHGAHPLATGKRGSGLLLGLWRKEFALGETPLIANTFLHQFVDVKGEFPCQDFRLLGWVNSSTKGWWAMLTNHCLTIFNKYLKEIGLYRAIRTVQ